MLFVASHMTRATGATSSGKVYLLPSITLAAGKVLSSTAFEKGAVQGSKPGTLQMSNMLGRAQAPLRQGNPPSMLDKHRPVSGSFIALIPAAAQTQRLTGACQMPT